MTSLAARLCCLSVCLGLLADGARVRVHQELNSGSDPFGDMLPPMQGNPNMMAAQQSANTGQVQPQLVSPAMVNAEERILASEALMDEQVELNQEERMEVECVGNEHLREVTTYENEQAEAENGIRSIRHFDPTEAEHKCLTLHKRNKKMSAKMFKDTGASWTVNPPAFPERVGEIVVESVLHNDKTPEGHHVVLEIVGCTSCENDYEDYPEWGGLASIDETGAYRKMYTAYKTDNFGSTHWSMGDRKPIVSAPVRGKYGQAQHYPPEFSFERTPANKQKYLKTYKYKYSSFKFDAAILDDVKALAQKSLEVNSTGAGVDAQFINQHIPEEIKILHELREQEKHMPFNHKLEEIWMNIFVCQEQGQGLVCPPEPNEKLIIHDGALMFDSSSTAVFDDLGRHSSPCAFGPCMQSRGMQDGTPFTMCSGCSSSRRCGTSSRAYPHSSLGQAGMFNCIVDRLSGPGGQPVDMMLQQQGSTKDPTARVGAGMFFRGSESKGHVTGHINWHLTVPRAGHCEPFLQDVAYIGIGVDECDKCQQDDGAVDVDIGMVLLKCERGNTKALGGTTGRCAVYDHANYAHRKPKNYFYAIAEDDRGGGDEGDDEWAFLNLAELKKVGVTHAMIVANIFGCESGRPTSPIGWQDLEGAFLRVTGSSNSQKDFENAETISYIDLDGMTGPAKNGAGLLMFYLADDDHLAAPEQLVRDDASSKDGSGQHWRMVVAKAPYSGRSMNRDSLGAFGLQVATTSELDLPQQVDQMNLPTVMATEQNQPALGDVTPQLMPVLEAGVQDNNNFHPSGESSEERQAKHMTQQELWHKLTITLPEGAPGTDTTCAANLMGPRK